MKKLISILVCLTLLAAVVPALAADRENRQPDVFVQSRKVLFPDQKAYISDEGRTLVPARGVFEYMGCTVDWNGELRQVTVVAKDETKVTLTIDSAEMTVQKGEEITTQTLDCPAQIMNDRTMVPLKAISLAVGSTVVWNGDAYAVYITPKETISDEEFKAIVEKYLPQPEPQPQIVYPEFAEDEKMIVSLVTEDKDVKAGDEFTVYIAIENAPADYKFEGIVATVKHDAEKAEYIEESATQLDASGAAIKGFMDGENAEYANGIRMLFLVNENWELPKESIKVVAMRFKALADTGVELALNYDLDEDEQNETYLVVTTPDGDPIDLQGDRLIVKTEPLKIN